MLTRLLPLLAFSLSLHAAEPAFVPLFPKDGVPTGWPVRHWADVSKPAEGAPSWSVKDGTLTGSGDRGCWFISEKEFSDLERKRHAGDLYARDSVSVIGIPYDIYEHGIRDFENGRLGAHPPQASVRHCWTLLSAADSRGSNLPPCTG